MGIVFAIVCAVILLSMVIGIDRWIGTMINPIRKPKSNDIWKREVEEVGESDPPFNPFMQKLIYSEKSTSEMHRRIYAFSEKMREAMRLPTDAVPSAIDEKVSWTLDEYEIRATERPFEVIPGEYQVSLLEAVPMEPDFFKRTKKDVAVNGWHHKSNGTATEILPPWRVREEILQKIKEKMIPPVEKPGDDEVVATETPRSPEHKMTEGDCRMGQCNCKSEKDSTGPTGPPPAPQPLDAEEKKCDR